MAQNDVRQYTDYSFKSGQRAYNNSTDVFKWVIVTDQYSLQDFNRDNPQLSDFTQVPSSGNYVANTTIANTTWTKSGNVSILDGDDFSFAGDPNNPDTRLSILIYNDTSPNKDAFALIDMTIDGSSALDLVLGFTYQINADGIGRRTTQNT